MPPVQTLRTLNKMIVEYVVRENPRPGPHYSLCQGTLKVTYELTQEQMDDHRNALSKNQHNGI